MKTVGYYNGVMDEIDRMTVPMNDRAMFFGDGVYDATMGANRVIYDLESHLKRFRHSCELTRMPLMMSDEELAAELQKCVDAMDTDGVVFVYWQMTRGTAMRRHVFPTDGKPGNLMIYIFEAPLTDLRQPMHCITHEDDRFYMCNVKTLNLLPNVLASQEALEKGCEEAIYHRGERVTECAHHNVSILKDGVFQTAPLNNLILPGCGRKNILYFCKELGIPTREEAFTVEEMMNADEVIVSDSATFGIPVDEIDGIKVGGKDPETLRRIQKACCDDFAKVTGYIPDVM